MTMEDGGGAGGKGDEAEQLWRSTAREIRELDAGAEEFYRKVENSLYQPYFFADVKADFEQLMAQIQSIEKSLKLKSVKYLTVNELGKSREDLIKEKQDESKDIESDAQRISRGTRDAVRLLLRETSGAAGGAGGGGSSGQGNTNVMET